MNGVRNRKSEIQNKRLCEIAERGIGNPGDGIGNRNRGCGIQKPQAIKVEIHSLGGLQRIESGMLEMESVRVI